MSADTAWLQRFDLKFLHERAASRPQTEAEWDAAVPARHRDLMPWPGVENLLVIRGHYQRAHDDRRARGESCPLCEP